MTYKSRCVSHKVQIRDLTSRYKDKMGIDYVRSGNPRCPSLIVVLLSLLCMFFAVNWWSCTTQNFELLTQVTDMEDHLKVSGEELEKCLASRDAAEEHAKNAQSSVAQQRVQLEKQKTEDEELKENLQKTQDVLSETNKEVTSLKSSLTFKSTELESLKKLIESQNKTLEAFRAEKLTITSKLTEEEDKVSKLREDLAALRKAKGVVPSDNVVEMIKKKAEEKASEVDGVVVNGNHALTEDEDTGGEKADVPSDPVVAVLEQSVPVEPREREMGTP